MAVPEIASWQDAAPHLQSLKATVAGDVRPLVDLPGHAPFAICREVFSYVDHLGHLYTGRTGQRQVGERLRAYLKDILGKVDPNYAKRAGEIYQMFRCGPVHEFEPKVLENDKGQLLAWLCYAGLRVDSFEQDGQRLSVVHLEAVPSAHARLFWLPISTRCLIDDLMSSMEVFERAGPSDERLTAWNRAARELASPEPYPFVI